MPVPGVLWLRHQPSLSAKYLSVDECERVIHSFQHAIVFQLGVPVEDFTREDWARKAGKHFLLNNSVTNQAEAWPNSMGYRLAVSLRGGPCTGLVSGPLYRPAPCGREGW